MSKLPKKVKLFVAASILAASLLLVSAGIVVIYVMQQRAYILGLLEDPLEAHSEVSYIVWQYNSTYYAVRNMSTVLCEYFGADDDAAIQYAINETTRIGGGTVYVKSALPTGTYNAAVTLKDKVTLILEYGACGISVTIDSGATATLLDYHNFDFKHWDNGILTKFVEDRSEAESASYTVFTDGTFYFAKNGTTGAIDYAGTNASQIIQNAIDSLDGTVQVGGGVIAFHPGLYLIDTPIDITKAEVTLMGVGLRAPELKQANNTNMAYMFKTTNAGTRFVNLFLNGNKDNNTVVNTDGIRIENSGADISVEMAWIGYFRGRGINASTQTWCLRIRDSAIEFNGMGLYASQPLALMIEYSLFVGQDDCSIHCVSTNTSDARLGGVISSTVFTRSVNRDIVLHNMSNVAITGNFFGGDSAVQGSASIYLYDSGEDFSITGNTFDGRNNVLYGVCIDELVSNVTVQGNTFRGFITTAIWNAGDDNTINHNTGFVTERSGTSEASNNDWISFGVTFGNGSTPQAILLTVEETDANYIAQVAAKNSTHFQLYLYDLTAAASETVDKTINWYAEYRPP